LDYSIKILHNYGKRLILDGLPIENGDFDPKLLPSRGRLRGVQGFDPSPMVVSSNGPIVHSKYDCYDIMLSPPEHDPK
jgi:hypothetical protein